MPVKVESVEADLASGLSRTADRHGHGQSSTLGPETIPKGRSLLPCNRKDIRLRGVHPLRRDNAICHGCKFSIMLMQTHKFVTSIL